MHVGFGSLNTYSGSYRSNAALAEMPPVRRAATVLSAQELTAPTVAKNGPPSAEIEALRSSFTSDTASFASAAGKIVQNAGASLPPEVMISISSDGRLSVVNNRQDAARIEQHFERNPDISQQFSDLSGKAAVLRAADSSPDFAGAYQQLAGNPTAQRSLAAAKIAEGGVSFHVVLTPHGPEVFFAGAGVAKV